MKIVIVVVAHDGLQSILTGVGVVVNSFIEGFPEIKKKCGKLSKNKISLVCIAPYIQKTSKDYHKNIRKITERMCKSNYGFFEEIKTNSRGESQRSIWGDSNQWEIASKNAAEKINEIQKEYDQIIVLAHDTIFSLISKYLCENNKIKFIWIPHSLGKVFCDEHTDDKRIKIENEVINTINVDDNKYLGCIGDYFKKILIDKYFLKKEKVLPLTNGIYKKCDRFNIKKCDLHEIKKYQIPENKKIIFSSGRCVYQKGFDTIILACEKFLKENTDYHLVLLMPAETSNIKYINKIKHMTESLPKNQFTAIYEFDPKLPKFIFENKLLKIVIFASRFEGNPISIFEANTFCNKDVSFIYSDIPPLKNLLKNNASAISFSEKKNNLYDKMSEKNHREYTKINDVPNILDNYIHALDILL